MDIPQGRLSSLRHQPVTEILIGSNITGCQVLFVILVDIQDIFAAGHRFPYPVSITVIDEGCCGTVTGDGYEVVLPVTQVYQYIHEQFLFESSICGTYDEVNTSYRKN